MIDSFIFLVCIKRLNVLFLKSCQGNSFMFLCFRLLGHSPEKLTLTLKLVFIIIDNSFNLFFNFWWKSFTYRIRKILIFSWRLFERFISKGDVVRRVERAKILFQNERVSLMHRVSFNERIRKTIKNRVILCELRLSLCSFVTLHSSWLKFTVF